jgi:hypothetical protein
VNVLPRTQSRIYFDEFNWKAITRFETGPRLDATLPMASAGVSYEVTPLSAAPERLTLTSQSREANDLLEGDQRFLVMSEALYQLKIKEDGFVVREILAQAIGHPASATRAGAIIAQPQASDGALALADVVDLLERAFAENGADPDFIVCHGSVRDTLSNLLITENAERLAMEKAAQSGRLSARYRVTHWLNRATGKEIPVMADDACPQDTLFAFSTNLPYPIPGYDHGIEIETNLEYRGLDLSVTGATYNCAVLVDEVVKVYWLGGVAVLNHIASITA